MKKLLFLALTLLVGVMSQSTKTMDREEQARGCCPTKKQCCVGCCKSCCVCIVASTLWAAIPCCQQRQDFREWDRLEEYRRSIDSRSLYGPRKDQVFYDPNLWKIDLRDDANALKQQEELRKQIEQRYYDYGFALIFCNCRTPRDLEGTFSERNKMR